MNQFIAKTVITSHENRHCAVTTAAFGQVLDQLRERIHLHYNQPEQSLCPLGSCLLRFHGVRHPATLGSDEVGHFCPGWQRRKVSVSTHLVGIWRPCCSSTACVMHGSALASGDRKTSAVAALPVVLTPDEVVPSSRFWKASIVCSPSFCLWNGHADQ